MVGVKRADRKSALGKHRTCEFKRRMRLEEMQFFDPRREMEFSVNRLPHWQQALSDALASVPGLPPAARPSLASVPAASMRVFNLR